MNEWGPGLLGAGRDFPRANANGIQKQAFSSAGRESK